MVHVYSYKGLALLRIKYDSLIVTHKVVFTLAGRLMHGSDLSVAGSWLLQAITNVITVYLKISDDVAPR